jgi:mannose-6-phosphate isomerase-like protein (cupin superfamily)
MIEKYTEERPWGTFEQFCKNESVTVKILSVKAGEELSLQYHHKRAEFWRILSGSATIIIDDKETVAKPGDEFFIPIEAKHRIRTTDQPVQIMEIAFGHFDEEDIVRLEDKYARS